MSAAISTALPHVRIHVIARRVVVAGLTLLVALGLLATPATAITSTRLSQPRARQVTAGKSVVLRTRLVTPAGQPIAGRRVHLVRKYYGRPSTTTASGVTNRYGVASIKYRPTRSGHLRFVFKGDTAYAGTRTRPIRVRVVQLGTAAVREAARHRGKPYGYGASGPRRFDCSGFTSYVYGRLGTRLPRSSRAQRYKTRRIAKSNRRIGDLVFFHSSGGRVGHVAIYAGGNTMWDSPRPGKRVSRRPIYSSRVSYGRVA